MSLNVEMLFVSAALYEGIFQKRNFPFSLYLLSKQLYFFICRNLDAKVDFSEDETITGFNEEMLAFSDESCKSWWIGKTQFWVAALLAMTWPYRYLLSYKTGKIHYVVKKKLYISRPEVLRSENDFRVYTGHLVEQTDIDTNTDRLTAIPIDTNYI